MFAVEELALANVYVDEEQDCKVLLTFEPSSLAAALRALRTTSGPDPVHSRVMPLAASSMLTFALRRLFRSLMMALRGFFSSLFLSSSSAFMK